MCVQQNICLNCKCEGYVHISSVRIRQMIYTFIKNTHYNQHMCSTSMTYDHRPVISLRQIISGAGCLYNRYTSKICWSNTRLYRWINLVLYATTTQPVTTMSHSYHMICYSDNIFSAILHKAETMQSKIPHSQFLYRSVAKPQWRKWGGVQTLTYLWGPNIYILWHCSKGLSLSRQYTLKCRYQCKFQKFSVAVSPDSNSGYGLHCPSRLQPTTPTMKLVASPLVQIKQPRQCADLSVGILRLCCTREHGQIQEQQTDLQQQNAHVIHNRYYDHYY